jgi:hypothetical protein
MHPATAGHSGRRLSHFVESAIAHPVSLSLLETTVASGTIHPPHPDDDRQPGRVVSSAKRQCARNLLKMTCKRFLDY